MHLTEPLVRSEEIKSAMRRVIAALKAEHERLTELDQAMGDGDLGITAVKIADALAAYAESDPGEDLGKWVAGAGMAVNRMAPSTTGTLLATALIRAGKEAKGMGDFTPSLLATMLQAADAGVQERGKAKPGDKTLVDALHPAADAFASAVQAGLPLQEAGARMLAAAEAGRDQVTPLKSTIGRASWVGERTIGLVDPGCEALVVILRAIAG